MPRTALPHLFLLTLFVLMILIAAGCGDDDNPVDPGNGDPAPIVWTTLCPRPPYGLLNDVRTTDETTSVAVGNAGAIVRTTDGGANWDIIRGGTSSYDLVTIDIEESLGLAGGSGGSLLRSVDGGESWQRLALNLGGRHIRSIDVVTDSVAVIVGDEGLFARTLDGGANWTLPDVEDGDIICVSFIDRDEGMAVSSGYFLWTEDGGSSWLKRPGYHHGLWELHIVMTAGGRAISSAYLDFPTEELMIYTTDNGGLDWTNRLFVGGYYFASDLVMATPLIGYASFRTRHFRTADGGQSWSEIAESPGAVNGIDAFGADVITGVGHGTLVRSDDGGATWSSQFSRLDADREPGPECRDVWFTTAQTGFVCTVEPEGLYATTDGGETWTRHDFDAGVPEVFFFDEDTGLAVIENADMQRTTDGGQTWTPVAGTNGASSVHFADHAIGLATGLSGFIRRSIDGGQTWDAPVTSPTNAQMYRQFLVTPETVLVLGPNRTLFRSTNGGVTSWETIDIPIQVYDLDFTPNRSVGLASSGEGMMRTTDAGATWNQIHGDFGTLRDVAFADDLIAYAVANGGRIFKSDDAGLTWAELTSPTTKNLQAVRFLDAGHGYAVGSNGTILRAGTGAE